ncbi:MAG: tripartite tricarboxylate transporter TctB family protein [Pseudomonadota bacterium]
MRTANIIISILLIIFDGFYAFLIWRLPSRDLPHTLGAAFVPWGLAVCLFFLATLLLFGSLFMKKRDDEAAAHYSLKELGGIAGLLVLIFVYIQAMSYLGFIAANLVFLAILTLIAGARKILEIVLFSILTTAAVYILFQYFFNVPLPAGQIF